MLELFKARPKLGHLDSIKGSEILFKADLKLPDPKLIFNFLDRSMDADIRWALPTNYVIRDADHMQSWLKSFIRTDTRILNEKFNSDAKTFSSVVIANRQLSAVDLLVRLATVDVEGYTQYAISVAKLKGEEYICVE